MPTRSLLPTSRRWWLALLLLMIVSSVIYYTGYRISLPYVDHPDEPSFNLAAQMIIDSGTAKPMGYNAYPPGIISLNYLVLKAFNQTERRPASDFLPMVRLLTITVSLLSIIVVALLGYELAGYVAGLLAGVLWAFNPLWNEHIRFATADPFVTFFALASLWLVCAGTAHKRQSLNTAANYMLMLAIVFKTQAIFLLPLIFCLPLWSWWQTDDSAERRQMLRALFWNGFRWALFLFWLLALYPTLDANKIIQWVAPTDKMAFPTPQLLVTHLNITVLSTRSLITWLLIALVLALTAWWRKDFFSRILLLALIVAFVSFLVGISLFGVQQLRQMYFLVALGDLFTALALASLAKWIILWLASRRPLKLDPSLIAYALISLYTAIAILPAFSASVSAAQDAAKLDHRNELATYMDTSLPPAPHIASTDNHKTLNRDYGGYHGKNDFPLVAVANLLDKPLEDWRAQNVTYAIVPYNTDWQTYAPDQLLLLKSYPADPRYRGPSMQVLRLQPIQNRLDKPLQLGSLNLIGYDLSARQISAGSDVTLTYYWQAAAPTALPMRVFTHIYPLDRLEVMAQQDGLPLVDDLERRPTSTWDDPAEVLVSRPFTITLPANLPSGRYRVVLGFYDPVGNQRLSTPSGDTFVTVTEIEIVAPVS